MDLANDIYDALEQNGKPLIEWLTTIKPSQSFSIPEGPPKLLLPSDMFNANTVFFGNKRASQSVECPNRATAELLERVALLGIHGTINLPNTEKEARRAVAEMESRIGAAKEQFEQLAESRTGDARLAEEVIDVLMRWFVIGKE